MERVGFGLNEEQERRAAEVHVRAVIVDSLGGMSATDPPSLVDGKDFFDLALEAGVSVLHETVACYFAGDDDPYRVAERFYKYDCLIEWASDKALLVTSAEDILKAKTEGKVGLILGFQDTIPIGGNLTQLWIYYKLGLRILQLTGMFRNAVGDGCYEPGNRGLTRFGKQVVREANRMGIVVDLSHVGERSSLEAAELSEAPVIFSHSSVKALCDHPRNLTDDQIKAAARSGGVVGLCPHSIFTEVERGVRPTVNEFLNHIDYIVDLVGADHAGIGTDRFVQESLVEGTGSVFFERTVLRGFDGGYTFNEKQVKGFSEMREWPNLTRGLVARGYSDDDIEKILGGNFLRVFQEVWRSGEGRHVFTPATRGQFRKSMPRQDAW